MNTQKKKGVEKEIAGRKIRIENYQICYFKTFKTLVLKLKINAANNYYVAIGKLM